MSAPPPDIFLTHPSGSSNTPKQSSSSVFFIITLYEAPLYQTASANVVISFDNWLKKLKKISGPQAIFLRIHISSWNGGYNTDTVSDGKIQIICLKLRQGTFVYFFDQLLTCWFPFLGRMLTLLGACRRSWLAFTVARCWSRSTLTIAWRRLALVAAWRWPCCWSSQAAASARSSRRAA